MFIHVVYAYILRIVLSFGITKLVLAYIGTHDNKLKACENDCGNSALRIQFNNLNESAVFEILFLEMITVSKGTTS